MDTPHDQLAWDDRSGRPLAYQRSDAYQAFLEDEVAQPHQRYMERSPFYPTHVFAEITVHLDGEWHVIQENREVMVIDGLGYVRDSWEHGLLPNYDVDRYGNWYDLDIDRAVDGPWGPDPLPERLALYRESDSTVHLVEIAPTLGVRELPVAIGSISAATIAYITSWCDADPHQLRRLDAALRELPDAGWEVTHQEVLAVVRGQFDGFGDASGRSSARDGAVHAWYRSAEPRIETIAESPRHGADRALKPAPRPRLDPLSRSAEMRADLTPSR